MEVDSMAKKPAQAEEEEEDLYLKMKELQNKLEMIEIQEEYIKEEIKHLKSDEVRSKEEVSARDRGLLAPKTHHFAESQMRDLKHLLSVLTLIFHSL